MLCIYDMVGNFTIYQATVSVEPSSPQHGGLTFIRHNDIRNITAEWLSKVYYDVAIEPPLQPFTGESIEPRSANCQDEARADIHAKGFWGQRQSALFGVRVFHPNARSYCQSRIPSLYQRQEQQKKREYGDRIREVEQASFTPLVFATDHWGHGKGSNGFLWTLG